MERHSDPALPRALAFVVGLLLAQLSAQDAETTERAEMLACKVLVFDSRPGSVLFDVEVRNPTARTAEPALFLVRIGKPADEHRVERCPLPYAGRRGRGIAPQGLARYSLQIATDQDPRTLAVSVLTATFRDGQPDTAAPITVGAIRDGKQTIGTRTVRAASVMLSNRSNLPVDAILLGTFAAPHRGKALLTAHLAAGWTGEVAFPVQPTALAFRSAPGDEGIELERCEVVDWTGVEGSALAGIDATRALFAGYDNWVRWPEPWPNGEGTFRATYMRSSFRDGVVLEIKGRWQLKDVAPPLLFLDDRLDLEPRQALDSAIDAAFADLRRPARAEFAQRNEIQVADRGRFLVDGPGWPGQFGKLADVDGDRIVGVADAEAPATIWQNWLLQDCGGGTYLVVGRDTTQTALGKEPSTIERRAYGRNGDWIVPLTYRRETAFRGFRELIAVELQCDSLARRGAPAPGEPTGPGAAALRAAWANGYRYPTEPIALRAGFEVETPATDAIWLGQKRVKGSLDYAAFRGLLMSGRDAAPSTLTIDGKNIEARTREQLTAAVGDRLRLWALHDFAGRPPFDEIARGATVLADDAHPGWYQLGNCALAAIEVQDGFVHTLRWTSGLERTITWQKLGDFVVPVRVTTGDEVLTAAWKRVDKQWAVPVQWKFERAFGTHWGPETVRLTDVKK